ncbi:beta-glucosidase [Microbacterium sp. ASV81]|uniref:Glycoside hydrolase family 3 C-terminal domain-containing protein n=1 Tax=Microbacterium capsulatum TaxID=3041921 RepID=A0ABU0XJ38_9MICO|nr:glycoside hydrolase family 3 C-terminal domain-containing protein [Microbacterium sp. ASV81]MDQ4215121.1 glycoside hydrolase family 3 C-terminal domain-containing protein [Microbacterium sp. ASV81]
MSEQTGADWDSAATDERVEELLGRMSLDEKVAFVTGDLNGDFGFYADGVESADVPSIRMADGPAGVRINKGDVHGGRATSLPAPIALAATWDPDRAIEYGAVIGVECRATDHTVSLGPAVDIARVPIGGRTFESFGEDPALQSAIGVGVVRGIQAQGVQACAKHYAINNQEDHRSSVDAVIDERTMRELYLPPFEALVREGGVASMMGAFNRVNGEYACENAPLLRGILRDEFGFRGWIMSDYGANHSTARAANAGLDQEQPNEGFWGGRLLAAVQDGEVAEAVIDEKVRNILRPMVGLGQPENPAGVAEFAVGGHHALAQSIAEDAMVLLRNDGILPLAPVRTVALIGPDVDGFGAQGGGSSQVRPTRGVSPLDGLRAALGEDVGIAVVHGADPVTPGALLPGADAVGSGFFRTPDGEVGLHAEYWTNASFEGEPLVRRTDGQIELLLGFHNFPGFNASSHRYEKLPTELNGRMSVRYTGTLTVPVTGTYRFVITSLGTYAFEIDGADVARSGRGATADVLDLAPAELAPAEPTDAGPHPYGWGGDGGQPDVAIDEIPMRLEAGREYAIRMEYRADDPSQGHLLGAKLRLGWVPPAGVFSPAVAEAAAAAAAADVAVVVVRSYEAEADDRPDMQLPNGQNDLVRAVLAANPRTVVVLMTGGPVDVTGWGADPAALIQAWYPGQAQGGALARVLTGAAEPGGRLPLTLPVSLGQTPAASARTYPGVGGQVFYDEGVFVGYRGFDARDLEPAYPFGHGLGYTAWAFSGLTVSGLESEDAVGVADVTVQNTGSRAGSTVVQVYVGGVEAPVPMPPHQLAGFAKVRLEPGESQRVRVRIPRRAASYFDVTTHGWVTPAGEVEVRVGASSRDIRAAGVLVVGEPEDPQRTATGTPSAAIDA